MADVEAIATTRLEDNAASITISSIPGTYQHLELRMNLTTTRASWPSDTLYLRFAHTGGSIDTGSHYTSSAMLGEYSTTETAFSNALTTKIDMYRLGAIGKGTVPSSNVTAQIMDYADTTKGTTLIYVGGVSSAFSAHGNDRMVAMGGGCYSQTGAITSIHFYSDNQFNRGSVVSVYGWKDDS